MSTMRALLAAILLAIVSADVSAAAQPERDWAETATDDLHFIRAILRENHPGPVDAANPAFRDWYVRGFAAAQARAAKASDFRGYYFAVTSYLAGFHDGHLGALSEWHLADRLADKRFDRRWPHFTISYRAGRFYVAGGDASSPKIGAELVSCDGRPIAQIADENIGTYYGLWQLSGKRPELAPLVMIDEGNPFVDRPGTCAFRFRDRTETIALQWGPISGDELSSRIHIEHAQPAAEIRDFGKSDRWLVIPTFNVTDAASGAAMKNFVRSLEAKADALRNARIIVFDVRGNHGGSSALGDEILSVIWGRDFIERVKPRATAIDWRVSDGNLRFIRISTLPAVRRQFGADSDESRGYERLVSGMEAALADGQTFYLETPEATAATDAAPLTHARPVLLTDSACGSACLDFADVVLRLPGAVHFGAETGADTIYIDNRAVTLPSGLGLFGFSMKVHRGRPRGHNESYKPKFAWPGDMNDTAAIEKWIAETLRQQ